MSQLDSPSTRPRVVVLRTAQPAALGLVLRERAQALAGASSRVLSLPAGPYAYPFAAALELSRLFHANEETVNSDAAGFTRAAMARALGALLLADALVVIPRLDWLDAPSAALFADVVAMARLAAHSSFRMLGGLPEHQPARHLQSLLNLGQCSDEVLDSRHLPVLNVHDRTILCVLAAAPHPLEYDSLQEVSGLRKRALDSVLQKLASTGLIDAGPRIGIGSAFEMQPARDLTRFREALLESNALNSPDARLAVQAALGMVGPEAWQMGLGALADEEYALARFRFELARKPRHAMTVTQELQWAQTLAASGSPDAALGIYSAHANGVGIEHARLAFALCRTGQLAQRTADVALRRTERSGEHLLEIVALRAQLLIDAKRERSAVRLLQRIPSTSQNLEAPATRVKFMLALASALQALGRPEKALDTLKAASQFSISAALHLRLARSICQCSQGEAQSQAASSLLKAATMLLDVDNAQFAQERLGTNVTTNDDLRRFVAGGSIHADGVATSAWTLLQANGATLMATLLDGDVCVLPQAARAKPGLIAWLAVQLNQLAAFPGLVMFKLAAPPNAGELSGDVLIAGFSEHGPTLVFLSRAKLANSQRLLEQLHDPHALLRWMLKQGQIKADEIAGLLHALKQSTMTETP